MLNTGLDNYLEHVLCINDPDECYLSPTLLKNYMVNEKKPKHNIPKSDIWALAITIINLALLKKDVDIYDFENYEID